MNSLSDSLAHRLTLARTLSWHFEGYKMLSHLKLGPLNNARRAQTLTVARAMSVVSFDVAETPSPSTL